MSAWSLANLQNKELCSQERINVGDMSEMKLTERQWNILKLIMESPTITAKQMSETLSVTSRTIERDLAILKEKGILRREGNNNDGIWVVI